MYITVMSPALWPFGGHTIGPHHITAAVRNSESLGKRGKKKKKKGEGGEKQGRRRVCVGWRGYKNKARI